VSQQISLLERTFNHCSSNAAKSASASRAKARLLYDLQQIIQTYESLPTAVAGIEGIIRHDGGDHLQHRLHDLRRTSKSS